MIQGLVHSTDICLSEEELISLDVDIQLPFSPIWIALMLLVVKIVLDNEKYTLIGLTVYRRPQILYILLREWSSKFISQ